MKVIAGLWNSGLANKLGYKTKVLANINLNMGCQIKRSKTRWIEKNQHSASIQIIIGFAHSIKYLLPFILEIYNVKNLMNALLFH